MSAVLGILSAVLLCVGVGAVVSAPLAAQPAPEAGAARAVAWAGRAETRPTIDGSDDEPVWRTAARVGEFRQFEPALDGPPSFPTEFRVVCDEDDLFVFVRAFDAHPDSILRVRSRSTSLGPYRCGGPGRWAPRWTLTPPPAAHLRSPFESRTIEDAAMAPGAPGSS